MKTSKTVLSKMIKAMQRRIAAALCLSFSACMLTYSKFPEKLFQVSLICIFSITLLVGWTLGLIAFKQEIEKLMEKTKIESA